MRSNARSSFLEYLASAFAFALALATYPFLLAQTLFVRSLSRLRREPAAVSVGHEGISEMSLNDPQWGKRGGGNNSGGGGNNGGKNDGPPDLDQIVKKINQKIASLFGGKPSPAGGDNNGNSGGGFNAPSGAAMGGGVVLAIGIAIAVWLGTGFYSVEEGSKGVELRLGKYSQTTPAGLRWHWPYPIETVEIVNVSNVRAIEVGHRNNRKTKVKEEALMLTEDQNIVDVQFAVQYTLSSPEEFLFNNKNAERLNDKSGGEEAVRQVAETAMRQIVGKSKMDFVLFEGRADIGARVKNLMQQILNSYKAGILISTVTMNDVQPPEAVQASFNDAVRAKQDKERLKNEGEAYAKDILPKAQGLAARLTEEANGYKQQVVANAQGQASRFSAVVAEYDKAPQVTRERIYLETIQQVMQSTSKVIVDQKGGQNLLYLPLDKIMQMSGANAVQSQADAASRGITIGDTAPPAPTATTVTPSAVDPNPPRRDIRSRDGR
jgi:modulator of FtsH protease HflK